MPFDRTEILRHGEQSTPAARLLRRHRRGYRAASPPTTQLQGKELSHKQHRRLRRRLANGVKAFDARPASSSTCVPAARPFHGNPCRRLRRPSRRLDLRFRRHHRLYAKSASTSSTPEPAEHFVEVLTAPSFTAEAKAALASKANCGVLVRGPARPASCNKLQMSASGRLCRCSSMTSPPRPGGLKVVTKVQLIAQQIEDLLFAERVAKSRQVECDPLSAAAAGPGVVPARSAVSTRPRSPASRRRCGLSPEGLGRRLRRLLPVS